MNTPTPTPTPITDSAWAKTFEDDDDQCRAGNAATDMRDECAKIERELTALAAACDELRSDADELRGDVVRLTAERDQLRAEAQRFQRLQRFINTAAAEMKAGLITFGGIAELRAERDQLRARAERAEAELATERARLDSGTILLTVAGERVWHCGVNLRAAIDAGVKEDAQ